MITGAVLAITGTVKKVVFENKDDRRKQTLQQYRHIDERDGRDKLFWEEWHRTNSRVPRQLQSEDRPLRLPALVSGLFGGVGDTAPDRSVIDGGGVRGIISLIILQQIMKEVAPNALPCECFDLIGGTSTGGQVSGNLWAVLLLFTELFFCT